MPDTSEISYTTKLKTGLKMMQWTLHLDARDSEEIAVHSDGEWEQFNHLENKVLLITNTETFQMEKRDGIEEKQAKVPQFFRESGI